MHKGQKRLFGRETRDRRDVFHASDTSTASDSTGEEEEEEGWSEQEQAALEEAMRAHPSSMPKEERWEVRV